MTCFMSAYVSHLSLYLLFLVSQSQQRYVIAHLSSPFHLSGSKIFKKNVLCLLQSLFIPSLTPLSKDTSAALHMCASTYLCCWQMALNN